MSLTRSLTAAVAIGRNEGARLTACLTSLASAAIPVVYVDSASTDDSVATARRLGARVLSLDMSRPFNAARARAEGFALLDREVPGLDYVMFVDGDCEIEDGWLATAVRFLDDEPTFAAVCGRRRERFPDASLYNEVADREWNTPVGEAASCGGDALYRVAAYRAAGGFDPGVVAGEEPELCTRLRAADWRIMRLDTPMTIHDAAIMRFGTWWRRAVRSGFGYAQAWRTTRAKGNQPLYGRELARMTLWAVALPIVSVIVAVTVNPAGLLLWPLLLLLQWSRLAHRHGAAPAGLLIAAHYAALQGALRYMTQAVTGDAKAASFQK